MGKWLEDSDKENIEKETLEEQYRIVKRETNTSMVMQFGDMDISKLPVGTSRDPNQPCHYLAQLTLHIILHPGSHVGLTLFLDQKFLSRFFRTTLQTLLHLRKPRLLEKSLMN